MVILVRGEDCHIAQMDLRIRELLQERDMTAKELAEAIDADPGQLSRHINGKRRTNTELLTKIAEALGVAIGDLFERPQIPIVGYVGAGSEVYAIDDHEKGGGIDEIDAPPDCPPGAVAVRVRGESMFPVHSDGDVIVYDGRQRHISDLYQKRCIVGMPDGRRFLKVVAPGSTDQLVTLVSFNAPPMVDVVIEWAAPILWVRPA